MEWMKTNMLSWPDLVLVCPFSLKILSMFLPALCFDYCQCFSISVWTFLSFLPRLSAISFPFFSTSLLALVPLQFAHKHILSPLHLCSLSHLPQLLDLSFFFQSLSQISSVHLCIVSLFIAVPLYSQTLHSIHLCLTPASPHSSHPSLLLPYSCPLSFCSSPLCCVSWQPSFSLTLYIRETRTYYCEMSIREEIGFPVMSMLHCSTYQNLWCWSLMFSNKAMMPGLHCHPSRRCCLWLRWDLGAGRGKAFFYECLFVLEKYTSY